jgi:hypothetical protein
MAGDSEKIQAIIDLALNTSTKKQVSKGMTPCTYCHQVLIVICSHIVCRRNSMDVDNCHTEGVLSYLLSISEKSGLSRVYTHLSSISHHFRRRGLASPCDDIRVKLFMKGLKRKTSVKAPKRAKPLTLAILAACVQRLSDDDSIITWRTVWRMVISFSCFLRFDDLKRLKVINYLLAIFIYLLSLMFQLFFRSPIFSTPKTSLALSIN